VLRGSPLHRSAGHTIRDGDVLFALSTEAVGQDALDDFALGEIACDVAWDAIINAVEPRS
jgi:L-aminopeptidase/D-esterase-like protein